MGCCGKKSVDGILEPVAMAKRASHAAKVKSIVTGNWNAVLQSLKQIPDEKNAHYTKRLSICRACEFHTWLMWGEFYRYINDNGGLMKFMKEITSLEQWPLLSKQEYKSRRKLFCRVCKCFLLAKAASDDEECPQEKWKNVDIKEHPSG